MVEYATIPVKKFQDGLLPWQLDALGAFDRKEARFSSLEIHRRGRKTTYAINTLIKEACKNDNSSYVYVAPTYREARAIVWDDPNMLFTYLPDQFHPVYGWTKDSQKLKITFNNGSLLRLFGGDDPDSLRGVDAEGVVFDEWAMMKLMVWLEIFSPIIAQKKSRWAMFLYTPKGMNHATQMTDEAACIAEGYPLPTRGRAKKCKDGWYVARVTAEESGIIPFDELVLAKDRTPLALYEQEYNCARITDEEFTLITSAMIELLSRDIKYPQTSRRIIAVDPSMGGDECVAYVFLNTSIIDRKIMRIRDTMKIVGELGMLSHKHNLRDFIVDTVGIGQGIVDRLRELEHNVHAFNGGSGAGKKDRFINKRAEAWWYVMEQVAAGEVEYPQDPETRRQIPYGSRYKVGSSSRIQILPKIEIKEECGCSPDRAEAWQMGIYGLQFVEESVQPAITDFGGLRRPAPVMPRKSAQSGTTDLLSVNSESLL